MRHGSASQEPVRRQTPHPNVAPRPRAPPGSSPCTRRWNSEALGVEPVEPLARRHLPRAPDLGRQVEDQRQVRLEPARRGPVGRAAPPRPAVRGRPSGTLRSTARTGPRARRRPAASAGAMTVAHQLGASGQIEKELGHRAHRVVGIEHRLPGDLPRPRAARLPHDDGIHAARPACGPPAASPASTCPSPRAPPERRRARGRSSQRDDAAGRALLHPFADLLVHLGHQLLEVRRAPRRTPGRPGSSRGRGRRSRRTRRWPDPASGRPETIWSTWRASVWIWSSLATVSLSSRSVASARRSAWYSADCPMSRPEILRLVPDHAASLLRASRYRSRPKRSA